jgi:hypothetical protein
MKEKYCRYSPQEKPENCKGCEKGCLDKKPGMYINRKFEDAVKEMESNDRRK